MIGNETQAESIRSKNPPNPGTVSPESYQYYFFPFYTFICAALFINDSIKSPKIPNIAD